MKRFALLCLFLAFLSACAADAPQKVQTQAKTMQLRELVSPAASDSGMPELFTKAEGLPILSWLEKTGENKHKLKFSKFDGETWTEPQTIVEAENLFVNWADFPSVVEFEDGSLAAHWLVKNEKKPRSAYDIFIARSFDNGRNWTQAFKPHSDNTPTEHGFVSLVPLTNGNLGVFWLDGRKYHSAEKAALDKFEFIKIHDHAEHNAATNETMLRFAEFNKQNALVTETELDGRVCDCCQTAALRTAEGLLTVYRDRSMQENRDFSFVRLANGKWSDPQPLAADGWVINGCPVNGASLAANGNQIVATWFTNANEQPQVKLSFSSNAGASFGKPVRVDDGNAQGRVDVVMLEDGSAAVSWLSGKKEGGNIKMRRIAPDGTMKEIFTVAETSIARASGFPRLALSKAGIVIAWTEGEKPSQVRTAILSD